MATETSFTLWRDWFFKYFHYLFMVYIEDPFSVALVTSLQLRILVLCRYFMFLGRLSEWAEQVSLLYQNQYVESVNGLANRWFYFLIYSIIQIYAGAGFHLVEEWLRVEKYIITLKLIVWNPITDRLLIFRIKWYSTFEKDLTTDTQNK